MKARTVATAAIGALAVLALAAVGRLAIRLDALDTLLAAVIDDADGIDRRVADLELLARQ